MEHKIESLTALFLTNTLPFMRITSADEAVSNLETNIQDEIENTFIRIENVQNLKLNDDSDSFYPANKWNKFKNETWGYDCLVALREVEEILKRTKKPISQKFIKDVANYHKNEWVSKVDSINYKFSEPTYKKYKDYKKYERLSLSKIKMLAEGFIVLFFEKHKFFYMNYIKWIKNVDNLFCLKKNNEIINFSYTEEEYNTLKACIDSYSDLKEFDKSSFLDFIINILSILDDISRSRLQECEQIDESAIRKEVENFYSNIFDLPTETTGIMQGDKDNIIWLAVNDIMECFEFFRKKKRLTWKECKSNKGFKAFMNNRLYIHLFDIQSNQFILQWIKAQVIRVDNDYGVYINERAHIKNKVWIDENCQIGKCSIDEGCQIKNCNIDDDVILHKKVIVDGVVIRQGSEIGPDIEIKGIKPVTLCNGNFAGK